MEYIHYGHKHCFRPLSGNLIFQWTIGKSHNCTYAFPSPIGESYFSIEDYKQGKENEDNVSVPYRGILFFNKKGTTDNDDSFCFRPLSGNLIFQ